MINSIQFIIDRLTSHLLFIYFQNWQRSNNHFPLFYFYRLLPSQFTPCEKGKFIDRAHQIFRNAIK